MRTSNIVTPVRFSPARHRAIAFAEALQAIVRETKSWMVGLLLILVSPCCLAFDCGPNALTYEAKDPSGSSLGIRCVVYRFGGPETDAGGNVSPSFDMLWYGEGQPATGGNRFFGDACGNQAICSPPRTEGVHISGNGEAQAGPIGFTRVRIDDLSARPSTIALVGAVNETWSLTAGLAYTPLQPVRTCGPGSVTYEVRAIRSATSLGEPAGIRCVAKGPLDSFWYGTGQWPGQSRYVNIGHFYQRSTSRFLGGAVDLCDASTGATCNKVPDDSLVFTPPTNGRFKGWIVSGAWNEAWVIPGSYPRPTPPLPPICVHKPDLPICQR